MKATLFLALLVVGGVAYFVTGGGKTLGLGETSALPDSVTPPNSTFMGSEQPNPFSEEEGVPSLEE